MKNLIMGVLLLLPLSAFAEDTLPQPEPPVIYWAQKPVQCSTSDQIVELMKRFGEVPTIILEGETGLPNGFKSPSKFVIAMNPETETWTLLEFVNDAQACVLGSGKGKISLGKKRGTST